MFFPIRSEKWQEVASWTWLGAQSLLVTSSSGDACVLSTSPQAVPPITRKFPFVPLNLAVYQDYEKRGAKNGESYFVAATASDRTLRILVLSLNGNEWNFQEKHRTDPSQSNGVMTSVAWKKDGQIIITGGDDCTVRLWTRQGAFRAILCASQDSIGIICWVAGDKISYCSGENIGVVEATSLSSVSSAPTQRQWRAHENMVTCLEPCCSRGWIYSAGCDVRFRVWDLIGNKIFQSSSFASGVVSMQVLLSEQTVLVNCAVHSYICSLSGAIQEVLYKKEFEKDVGAQKNEDLVLAGGKALCSSGNYVVTQGPDDVLVLSLYSKGSWEYDRYTLNLIEPSVLRIDEMNMHISEDFELVDAKSHVNRLISRFGVIIIVTAMKEVRVFTYGNLRQSRTLSDDVNPDSVIIPGMKSILINKNVYTYDGKLILKSAVESHEFDNVSADKMIGLNRNFLIYCEKTKFIGLNIIGLLSNKKKWEFTHSRAITAVQVSQHNDLVAFIDEFEEAFLLKFVGSDRTSDAKQPFSVCKIPLCGVKNILFSETTSSLLCQQQGNSIYFLPSPKILLENPFLAEFCLVQLFVPTQTGDFEALRLCYENNVYLETTDGSSTVVALPSLYNKALMTLQNEHSTRWASTTALCRFTSNLTLWAILANESINSEVFDTAEVALASLGLTTELFFMKKKQSSPTIMANALSSLKTQDLKGMERCLLGHDPPLLYEACKLHIKLLRFERAEELAAKNGPLLSLVKTYRSMWENKSISHEDESLILSLKQKLGRSKQSSKGTSESKKAYSNSNSSDSDSEEKQ